MKQSLTMFILYVLFISESFIISVRVKQAYNLENKLKDVTNEFEKVKTTNVLSRHRPRQISSTYCAKH